MRKILLLASAALFFTHISSAQAASCYTPAEAEAEQGLRIHSELMVIGLNCQAMKMRSGGPNLYAQYRQFTSNNSHVFEDYEQKILDYFRRTGVSDPEQALNTLRTGHANKVAFDAAKMQPHMFCNSYADRILKVRNMDASSLKNWASTFVNAQPLSRPICR